MKPRSFRYVRASTLADACDLVAEHGESAALLAGGQSLMPLLSMRLAVPDIVVDINDLEELERIALEDDVLVVGALCRHRDVLECDLVREHVPLVAEALGHVAHSGIRNRGTFGGSIALADPAAELPACCVALGAAVSLRSTSGTREIAAGDFFLGPYTTARLEDEIVTAIRLPVLRSTDRYFFDEIARRRGDYALAGLAAVVRTRDAGSRTANAVYFGIADRPCVTEGLSGLLATLPPGGIPRDAVDRTIDSDLAGLDRGEESGALKLELANVLARRAIAALTAAPSA